MGLSYLLVSHVAGDSANDSIACVSMAGINILLNTVSLETWLLALVTCKPFFYSGNPASVLGSDLRPPCLDYVSEKATFCSKLFL